MNDLQSLYLLWATILNQSQSAEQVLLTTSRNIIKWLERESNSCLGTEKKLNFLDVLKKFNFFDANYCLVA